MYSNRLPDKEHWRRERAPVQLKGLASPRIPIKIKYFKMLEVRETQIGGFLGENTNY